MKKEINGTTIVLIFMAVFDILFTAVMIYIFYLYQSVPDSLIVAVFGATFGECGFCTLIYKIKKNKENKQDGLYRSVVSDEIEAICDQGHAGNEDPRFTDSCTGIY